MNTLPHKKGNVTRLTAPIESIDVTLDSESTSPTLSCILFGQLGNILDCTYSGNDMIENGSIIRQELSEFSQRLTLHLSQLNLGVTIIAIVMTGVDSNSAGFSLCLQNSSRNEQYVISEDQCTGQGYILGLVFRDSGCWKFLPAQEAVTKGADYVEMVPHVRTLIRTYGISDPRRYCSSDFSNWLKVKLRDVNEYLDLPLELKRFSLSVSWKGSSAAMLGLGVCKSDGSQLSESETAIIEGKPPTPVSPNSPTSASGGSKTIELDLDQVGSDITSIFAILNMLPDQSITNLGVLNFSLFHERRKEICSLEYSTVSLNSHANSVILCKIHRHCTLTGQGWRLQLLNAHVREKSCYRVLAKALTDQQVDVKTNLTTFNQSAKLVPEPVKKLAKPRSTSTTSSFFDMLEDQDFSHLDVKINVLNARNLASMDLNGFSDPYFKIFLDENLLHTSKVIKKSLNPTWNESVHKLLETKSGRWLYQLRIEFWDQDKYKADDALGVVTLELDLDVDRTIDKRGCWYSLKKARPTDSNKVSGEVLVDLVFELRQAQTLD